MLNQAILEKYWWRAGIASKKKKTTGLRSDGGIAKQALHWTPHGRRE